MENRLLDRVDGNADVHRWSEKTHLEKGDSITMGYVLELSDYTCISVTQNNLQELKEIWDQWGNKTKQLFYDNYGYLPYLLDIQEVDLVPTVEEYTALLRCPRFLSDRIYSRAACVPTFWKKLMTITGMSEQWITARIKEKGECKCISWDALKDLILTHPDETKKVDIFALSFYGLMVFPEALGYVDEATTDLFHRLSKRVTSVPAILAETFRSLGACKKAGAGRKVDALEENWIALLRNLQSGDVEWRAPWMVPGEILYRCGSFDWVPLLGIWGAIGYAPLLVLRQHGLRRCVPATHGLAQSEFVYRRADYKRKVSKVSSTWNKTCRLKGVAIGPVTTPEYVEWRKQRINDNVSMTKIEETRPMEEYLQVIPSELDIIKQEFKRKNLELEKKIEKLEEEKIYLSLDVDLQKKEVEKFKKEKRKVEEDEDDFKEEYKKAKVSLKRVGLGKSSEQWQKETKVNELGRSLRWHRNHDPTVELEELKSKVEDLEVALHDGELQIEQLEAQKDCIKGELHQVKGQVMNKDYIIGEAIAQIREIAENVRDLALRADVLGIMYESASDKGQEFALLLDKGRPPWLLLGENCPPGFTPPYVPLQTEAPPRRPSVTVRPQHGPVDAGVYMNYPNGSGFNLGDNPTNPLVPDPDMVEKEDLKAEAAKQLDERCRWLEEKFKTLEGAGNHHGIDAKDISLVPDLVLPHKFKMPDFEKYNGTTCPEAHMTMFCRRMTGYVNNDQLLIHCFQDSLVGAAARWYNQLNRTRINSWRALA
ncbi:hypothetical protein CXB51_033544 [Gossypium anomalum]|uniref:DUF7745 domain-containing protein n=1 Tax=Gossypium anomalum TaxID=47600 RepID=A0A8J5Y1F3_9ROSI|nr:hypothetical protein CXB51_033544 [Gossypium anomalum]